MAPGRGWFNLEAGGGVIPDTSFFEGDSAFKFLNLSKTTRLYGFVGWCVTCYLWTHIDVDWNKSTLLTLWQPHCRLRAQSPWDNIIDFRLVDQLCKCVFWHLWVSEHSHKHHAQYSMCSALLSLLLGRVSLLECVVSCMYVQLGNKCLHFASWQFFRQLKLVCWYTKSYFDCPEGAQLSCLFRCSNPFASLPQLFS